MCLGLPGKVIEIQENSIGMTTGKVCFPDSIQQVCLAYLPEVHVGDYVMVHFGFATERLEQDAACRILGLVQELDQILGEEESP